MEIFAYILLFLLVSANVYLIYKAIDLQKQLNKLDKDHKKQLVDAGNAITDTLKVAFDNLKRNSSEHNKINSKLTEYNSRIHRLEHMNRSPKDGLTKNIKIESKEENENE
jgi:hypothetical protein